jgi:HSP20 family protein
MPQAVGAMLEMARIQSEINRLFDNMLELQQEGAGERTAWVPNADIVEGPTHYVVQVELPGVPLSGLTLAVDGGNIILRGEKNPPRFDAGAARTHLSERDYGRFERIIAINAPVNTHKAEATYQDGVLKIAFPKVDNRRGGEVSIPVSEG